MSPPKMTMIRIASIRDWAPTNQYDGRLSFMNPRSRPTQSTIQKVMPLNPSSLLPTKMIIQNAMNGENNIIGIIGQLLLSFRDPTVWFPSTAYAEAEYIYSL
jgi:hypothetical protein